jgi:hypothetical protein
MKIVNKNIRLNELEEMSKKMHGGLVKAVVDIKKEIMVVDASMHSDEEQLLLKEGSLQENLWGINLYPALYEEDFIEFDSMINLRPSQGNYSRSVENVDIQKKLIKIVNKLTSK